MQKPIILEKENKKFCISPDYNYVFDKTTGLFMRWGKTPSDDPARSEIGPEIADIEISTKCSGIEGPCKFCYKSNNSKGENMSFEDFKIIFASLGKQLTQIAFGIGDIDANPDLWKIMEHCRENEVIPNITINGSRMIPEYFDKLANLCGAVAVSRYNPEDYCYNAVQTLCGYTQDDKYPLKQVNIHMLLSKETYEDCYKVINDKISDPRLERLNAIVFLSLKPKGRGVKLSPIPTLEAYRELIDYAMEKEVPIGFDSCSAPMFIKVTEDRPDAQKLKMLAEPCESGLFSVYIDVKGQVWPCSFSEGVEGIEPQNLLIGTENGKNFSGDFWNSEIMLNWVNKLRFSVEKCDCQHRTDCRACPIYLITKCKETK
jgi:MoaA/NifB/PqqE/SkfB family radical SAM enzyme